MNEAFHVSPTKSMGVLKVGSSSLAIVLCFASMVSNCIAQPISAPFQALAKFNEQVHWRHESNGVRALILAPNQWMRDRRCLVIYATPNGNSIEQSLGCNKPTSVDWRFDIQHVAAQIRWLRNQDTSMDYILAVVQSPQLSWPEFRRTKADANRWIMNFVESIRNEVSATDVVLACHSGGGSFLWGWMNAHEELPNFVNRMVFLDANYSFSTEDGHDRKLLPWLTRTKDNALIVIAYDDREIELDGKKVVGKDGGTYRATQRMQQIFSLQIPFSETQEGDFCNWLGMQGRIQFRVHQNPKNQILHTALVGEMNGLAFGLAVEKNGVVSEVHLSEPRVYSEWIQAEPFQDPRFASAFLDRSHKGMQLNLPPRPSEAEMGSQFCERVAKLALRQREAESVKAILEGNVPSISRDMVGINVTMTDKNGRAHQATYYVMSDYMAIGSDADYVRIPLTPNSAIQIGDKVNGELITDKISDDVYSASECRIDPHPLTADRDQVSAFVAHNIAIKESLQGQRSSQLVVGIKKDIVMTNRLKEKSHRVAIYGWHYRDGRVIQPLYIGHVDWYVDYSHGLRVMSNRMLVDGVDWKVRDVLLHEEFCELLSREGTVDVDALRSLSQW